MSWSQVGSIINGDGAYSYIAQSVSLSADGSTLAIGIPKSNAYGSDSGCVCIYHWTTSAWVQQGEAINGTAVYEGFGSLVSLSADSATVAIGTPGTNKYQNLLVLFVSTTGQEVLG